MSFVIDHPADLVNGLGGENGKAMAEAAVAELGQFSEDIQKTLDKGVSPDDFKRLQTVQASLGKAGDIIAMMYVLEHPEQ